MTEPIYEFERGKGWVVKAHEERTFTVEGVTITLIKRKPEIAERFFTGNYSLEQVEGCLKDTIWRRLFLDGTYINNIYEWDPARFQYLTNANFITVIIHG